MIYSIKNSLPGYLATAGKYSAVNREEQYKKYFGFRLLYTCEAVVLYFFFFGTLHQFTVLVRTDFR